MYGIIYKVTNIINGKMYIGQTKTGLKARKRNHKHNCVHKKYNSILHSAIRKYGWDNFRWEIIDSCYSFEQLNKLEIYYIGYYNTYNNGYNATLGGAGKPTPCSEDTKRKISEANKGRNFTEEHKNNISKSMVGLFVGKDNPFYGKRHTEDTRRKMSKAACKNNKGAGNPRARPIILIHPDESEEYFGCITFAATEYNLSRRCLCRVASGKRNHHKGFKCKYV